MTDEAEPLNTPEQVRTATCGLCGDTKVKVQEVRLCMHCDTTSCQSSTCPKCIAIRDTYENDEAP